MNEIGNVRPHRNDGGPDGHRSTQVGSVCRTVPWKEHARFWIQERERPGRTPSIRALLVATPFLWLAPMLLVGGSQSQTQSGEWWIRVTQSGRRVYLAVPDFEVVGSLGAEHAKTLSEVVWNDQEFASIYRLVPKKVYGIAGRAIPSSLDYYSWESIGADILVLGTLEVRGEMLVAEIRIYAIQAQQMVFGKRYEARVTSIRNLAHKISDDILQQVGNYQGVARSKIAFCSDRAGERSKEIYFMDYDGYDQRPLTANRSLNLSPSWRPDGRALGYISYQKGNPDLFRRFIYEGREDALVAGQGMTFAPAWSPNGQHIAFSSTRDGNSEIYVIEADGSGLMRLTHHDAIDTSPCWSPNGKEIVFTSDRSGTPQIYVMGADGMNLRRISYDGSYNDAPAWSPSTRYSEIAFASRIERGPFDIVVYDFGTEQLRQVTTGQGSNESPSWSPNGQHMAFSSTRNGKPQIFTMNRDGSNQRSLTRDGNNTMPKWGPNRLES